MVMASLMNVGGRAQTVTRSSDPPVWSDRSKHALIITGIGGGDEYSVRFNGWKNRLKRVLIDRLGFAGDQVLTFTEKPDREESRSTAVVVSAALSQLQGRVRPEQQLFVFIIGHGSFDGETARLNLPGPDLTVTELAKLLGSLAVERLVVVSMTSASGEIIKLLGGPGRVLVSATRSGLEQNAPKFAEHFITALENPVADLDRNRRISLLEAFEYGTKQTSAEYERTGRLATEHALIEDNGDGVGHPQAEAGDGGLARVTYLDSLPRQQAGGDLELAQLFEQQLQLEGLVEQLKGRKDRTPPQEYLASLEKILTEMARLNRAIRTRQKR